MSEHAAGTAVFRVAFLAVSGLILWSIGDSLRCDWLEWWRSRNSK